MNLRPEGMGTNVYCGRLVARFFAGLSFPVVGGREAGNQEIDEKMESNGATRETPFPANKQ